MSHSSLKWVPIINKISIILDTLNCLVSKDLSSVKITTNQTKNIRLTLEKDKRKKSGGENSNS